MTDDFDKISVLNDIMYKDFEAALLLQVVLRRLICAFDLRAIHFQSTTTVLFIGGVKNKIFRDSP